LIKFFSKINQKVYKQIQNRLKKKKQRVEKFHFLPCMLFYVSFGTRAEVLSVANAVVSHPPPCFKIFLRPSQSAGLRFARATFYLFIRRLLRQGGRLPARLVLT
jgi:hypothetical protein